MQKKLYISPEIDIIKLDNNISLQLESEPPIPEGELTLNSLLYPQGDIFNKV